MTPVHHQIDHWQMQWDHWQNRLRQNEVSKQQRAQHEAIAAEMQRVRIFGGEIGDEVSLCAPMLQVVTGLFGGLDYEDP